MWQTKTIGTKIKAVSNSVEVRDTVDTSDLTHIPVLLVSSFCRYDPFAVRLLKLTTILSKGVL
jgi:hypothetical protein